MCPSFGCRLREALLHSLNGKRAFLPSERAFRRCLPRFGCSRIDAEVADIVRSCAAAADPLARAPQAPSVLILDLALSGALDLITCPLLLSGISLVLGRPRLRPYFESDRVGR